VIKVYMFLFDTMWCWHSNRRHRWELWRCNTLTMLMMFFCFYT